MRLLHRLGVYEQVIARGFSGANMTLHSLQGSIVGSQDLVGWAREETGFGYVRIKRADLVDVLLDAVHEAGIPVCFGRRVESIEEREEGVVVSFEDGCVDSADLLLGCDGIHSFVRCSWVDPSLEPEYSGMSGLSTLIPASVLSPEAMEQIAGLEATLTEEGMLVVNPCTPRKDELYMFFSKQVALPDTEDTRDGWEVHGKDEVDGFKTMLLGVLEHAQGKWGSTLKELVDKASAVKFYPIYRLPSGGNWSKGRCVLVGDAAHAMSPHAGQGVSMAMEDVFLLSRLLEDPARPLSEVFKKYNDIRRPRVDEISNMASQNANIRRKTGTWGLWFREIGLSVALGVSSVLGLDKRGMKQKHLVYDIDQAQL